MCGITTVFSKNNNIFNETYESASSTTRGQDIWLSYLDNDKQIKIINKQDYVNNQLTIESNIVMGHVRYQLKVQIILMNLNHSILKKYTFFYA